MHVKFVKSTTYGSVMAAPRSFTTFVVLDASLIGPCASSGLWALAHSASSPV
jgi:hypothetical protein